MKERRTRQSPRTYYNESFKHSLVEDFTVSYYNHSIRLDLGERDLNGEPVIHTFDDGLPKDEKNKKKILSYSTYRNTFNGEITQWYVRFLDERFSDFEELMGKYSGHIETPIEQKPKMEKAIYSRILLLLKEKRVNGDFKLEPLRNAQLEILANKIDRVAKLLEKLEERVSRLEKPKARTRGIK